jgi:hypothetical protein
MTLRSVLAVGFLAAAAAVAAHTAATADDTPKSDPPAKDKAAPPPDVELPKVPAVQKVTGPFAHGNLAVFLLHGPESMPGRTPLTLQEAMTRKKAVVHETESVNQLSVENGGDDIAVFIHSGDIVRGGKQDRLIAFDMLIPAKSGKVALPSFCVESGRWQQRSGEDLKAFNANPEIANGVAFKRAVNIANSQGEVWKQVGEAQSKLAANLGKPVQSAASPTSYQLSLEDKDVKARMEACEKELAGILKDKPDAIGMAVAINGRVVAAEVYGSAGLFVKLWPKLLRAAGVEALAEKDDKKKFEPATAKLVEAFLADAHAVKGSEMTFVAANVNGRGQQRAAQIQNNINPPAQQQQVEPVQQQAQPAAPPANEVKTATRIYKYDGKQTVLVESRERAEPGAVLHRSYFAK